MRINPLHAQRHFLPAVLLMTGSFLSTCQVRDRLLTSPGGQLRLEVSVADGGIGFHLMSEKDTLLSGKSFGLQVNGMDYTKEVRISGPSIHQHDETWETVNGKYPVIRNHYMEYKYEFSPPDPGYPACELFIRLYDEGMAYRYRFPEQGMTDSTRIAELTRLHIPADFTYWAYNGEHHNVGPVRRAAQSMKEVRIPMVIRDKKDRFLAIHEAAIFDFAPFSLNASAPDGSITFNTDYSPRKMAFKTSWRAFIAGERVGDLVESSLLVNLNDPCRIEDPSWIRPGKSMWDWRVWGYVAPDGFEYGLNTESHLRFIDFASEHNIQYLLIDADWYGAEFSEGSDPTTSREGVDIEACMQHARDRDVGVILYLNDLGARRFGLERVLKQFADWGAVGVKYGFMRGTWEEKVRQTRRVVELCAGHRLMVDFHDNPVPPSGDRRTWPNLVTKEYNHAQADARRSYDPETAVNTPLINMIAGPLDATNGWFDLNGAHSRVKVFEEIPGTVAAEVAKLIVIYTGWMVLPDAPEAYLEKADLFECIRQMPAQFDGFKVLDAEIDGYITVARSAGEDWFIGSLSNREARELEIDLGFLPEGNKYRATLYEDASDAHFLDNKEAYRIRTLEIDPATRLSIRLAPGGGNAIHLQAISHDNH